MSLLQKAIRRGEKHHALRAAATLLWDSPDRLWRRLGVIAFEDVGVADLETIYLVTAALAGKRYRAQIGGEWAVASFLISHMANAPKCRAADDLLMVCNSHPSLAQARLELASLSSKALIETVLGSGPIPERALATWYAAGTDRCPSEKLPMRKGDPNGVFDALCEAGWPHTVVEVAREGLRKVGEVLCPFIALLCRERPAASATVLDDEFPPEVLIGGVPSWAFDIYSRDGRRGLEAFLRSSSETARWVRGHIPVAQRVRFLGGILFAVEGGLLRSRLNWPTGNELRRQVDTECHGPHCPDASEVLDLLRRELPALNRVRSHVRQSAPSG